jgi:hypothetical protein
MSTGAARASPFGVVFAIVERIVDCHDPGERGDVAYADVPPLAGEGKEEA